MKHIAHCMTLALFIFHVVFVFSQTSPNDVKAAQQLVNAEQKMFRDYLNASTLNATVKKSLQKFAVNDVNSIQTNLQFLVTAPREKRVKGIRSLSYFMKELQEELKEKKIDEFSAPSITKKYKQTLNDLLDRKNEPIEKNLSSSSWRTCQLLANSFWEFDEKKQMSDISAYKRVVETPEYIFSFLERTPGFYYTDSLIIFLAENYPEQLVAYLQKNNNAVTRSVRSQKNIYVQQLAGLSSTSLASELAPFAKQIADSELLIDDILVKRKKVTDYFQLLVNTVMSNNQKKGENDEAPFQMALENALARKSLDFYVKKINDLHSSPDAVRFQSVQTLRPQDLYYIIVSADEEMYTSTYLGLYKRLLGKFKDQSADSVLNTVYNDKFRKFMRIAATYNTLNDFLHHTTTERSKTLVHLFISDIENDNEDEAISNASDIADAFITLSKDSALNTYVNDELEAALKKNMQANKHQSTKLYSILLKVYGIVNNDQPGSLSENYKTLPYSELKNNGAVSELVLFYGDEDGKNSFASFMDLFKDRSQWEVTTNDSWTVIGSLKGQPVKIYANLPLSEDDEKDVAAQEALAKYLKSQSISPSILIHRGHSYHLQNTLNYLDPSVKLAILGSCGGYKNMKKIMELNSQVQIIASKQVGSMAVNDPLLRHLNDNLALGKNIDWISFWDEMKEKFKNDGNTSKFFEEYMPPYNNVSSYVIRLYNEDDSIATQ
ncbi:MAG TPA: hypothetical protein VGQ53_18300 [Chitinophagaceae bacterium]|jgi:hypothetical protein|nr:hypothetical protein [Chitinophagaceae bacterium]